MAAEELPPARQRRVGLVHEVEPSLVDARAQDLQESLAVAELMEPLARGRPAAIGHYSASGGASQPTDSVGWSASRARS